MPRGIPAVKSDVSAKSPKQEIMDVYQEAAFPEKLEIAICETETAVSEKLTFQYQFKTELQEKELEGERKLSEQRIAALQDKIKEQEQHIRHLLQKTEDSTQHAQTIAIKAIEGAQGMTLRGLGSVATEHEGQKVGSRT
jgi:predicted ribosome quality control (RQC) complex YloA/Tae2 family protein